MKAKDRPNQTFGRLTVTSRAGSYVLPCGQKRAMWNRRCACGNEKIVSGGNLRSGEVQSCGCLRREVTTARLTKHGHNTRAKGETGIYRSWCNMINRITNPNVPAFKRYGDAGVPLCDEWRNDFRGCLRDNPGWFRGAELHRKVNELGYCKGNTIWLSASGHSRLHNQLRKAA
jgi:hypothetical protein